MAVDDTVYHPGDSNNNILRKLLQGFKSGVFSITGGGGGGGGGAVTVADGADVTQGAKADSKATDSTSSWSTIALLKGIFSNQSNGVVVTQPTAANLNATVTGNVGGRTSQIVVTPTISTSAYVAGYTVGGIQTLTNALLTAKTGILESLIITGTSNQSAPFDIFLFGVNPAAATTTDHAAFTFSTDITNVIARVSVTAANYVSVGSTPYAIAALSNLGMVVKGGAATLYAVAVTSGTPTYGSTTALQFSWGFLQD